VTNSKTAFPVRTKSVAKLWWTAFAELLAKNGEWWQCSDNFVWKKSIVRIVRPKTVLLSFIVFCSVRLWVSGIMPRLGQSCFQSIQAKRQKKLFEIFVKLELIRHTRCSESQWQGVITISLLISVLRKQLQRVWPVQLRIWKTVHIAIGVFCQKGRNLCFATNEPFEIHW
jgi:hypothetical protein